MYLSIFGVENEVFELIDDLLLKFLVFVCEINFSDVDFLERFVLAQSR